MDIHVCAHLYHALGSPSCVRPCVSLGSSTLQKSSGHHDVNEVVSNLLGSFPTLLLSSLPLYLLVLVSVTLIIPSTGLPS